MKACITIVIMLMIPVLSGSRSGDGEPIVSYSVFSHLVKSHSAERELRWVIERFYGGECLVDMECLEEISFCDRSAGIVAAGTHGLLDLDGQCRPTAAVWVLAAIAVIIILVCCINSCRCRNPLHGGVHRFNVSLSFPRMRRSTDEEKLLSDRGDTNQIQGQNVSRDVGV